MAITGFSTVASFTASHKTSFKTAIASLLSGVASTQVDITSVALSAAHSHTRRQTEERSRRLAGGAAGLDIKYEITGITSEEASAAKATFDQTAAIETAFKAAITTEMTAAGNLPADGITIESKAVVVANPDGTVVISAASKGNLCSYLVALISCAAVGLSAVERSRW
jgi:hypothetical protein